MSSQITCNIFILHLVNTFWTNYFSVSKTCLGSITRFDRLFILIKYIVTGVLGLVFLIKIFFKKNLLNYTQNYTMFVIFCIHVTFNTLLSTAFFDIRGHCRFDICYFKNTLCIIRKYIPIRICYIYNYSLALQQTFYTLGCLKWK